MTEQELREREVQALERIAEEIENASSAIFIGLLLIAIAIGGEALVL